MEIQDQVHLNHSATWHRWSLVFDRSKCTYSKWLWTKVSATCPKCKYRNKNSDVSIIVLNWIVGGWEIPTPDCDVLSNIKIINIISTDFLIFLSHIMPYMEDIHSRGGKRIILSTDYSFNRPECTAADSGTTVTLSKCESLSLLLQLSCCYRSLHLHWL